MFTSGSRLVECSGILDTISLITMTHTIYFIANAHFKQYCMVIEHVNTTVLIRKKQNKKTLIF